MVGLDFQRTSVTVRPKPSLIRFLHDERRSPLSGIDFQGAPGRKIKNDNVRIFVSRLFDLFENCRALGIVE
jgi:hypothetical protein